MKRIPSVILKTGLLLILSSQCVYAIPKPPKDGETPGSLACIYGLTPHVPGCPIGPATAAVPKTGSGIIAVIEGADDPSALDELKHFSRHFGLNVLESCDTNPAPCLQTYYAATCKAASDPLAGPAPPASGDLEPEIDFEWSHAMAPFASIYIVEANSWNINDMMQGVACANQLLSAAGGGFISFSKSYNEFPNEKNYDANFTTPGIVYVASAGDYQAPARYPSASPNVVSVGGTMIERDPNTGMFLREVAWKNTEIPCNFPPCKSGGTGGPSAYEPRPAYQNSVQRIVGTHRGTPDVAFAAQRIDLFCCLVNGSGYNNQCPAPTTSCPTDGRWVKNGGTSLAAPAMAGVLNSAHAGAASTAQQLSIIYNNAIKNYHRDWTDIIYGNNGYSALVGYDFTTGLGVPNGYRGK